MKIINCTPHDVHIIREDGTTRTIPASGIVARLSTKTVPAGEFDGIPITRTEFGEPEGLPEYEEGTRIIASQIMKSACPHRTDIIVPAEIVRDEKGVILGCRSLGL